MKKKIQINSEIEFEWEDDELAKGTVGSEGAKNMLKNVNDFGTKKKETFSKEASHSRYIGKRWVRRGFSSKYDEEEKRERRREK